MQKEFNIEDYKLAGHLSPWKNTTSFYANEFQVNPYTDTVILCDLAMFCGVEVVRLALYYLND